MKKSILLIPFWIINLSAAFSQSKLNINYACSYYGEKNPTSVYTFTSDNEAQSALKMITDASGLSTNFKLVAANVPNAAAVIFNNQRYILYNQTFMYNIGQRINYWASISILAHEVGHHLNGHSLTPGGSRPGLELEADKFSGFILAKLGATLNEAQLAINTLVPESGSLTHPGRSARLAAIASGWYQNSSSKVNSISRDDKKIIRPNSISELSYKKKNEYVIGSEKINIQVSAGDYTFNPSEYKVIIFDYTNYTNVRKGDPTTLVIYMSGYEKYYYVHDFELDPVGIDMKLKTIWDTGNPYMFIVGLNTIGTFYKGERIEIEDYKSPNSQTGNFSSKIWRYTFKNSLNLYMDAGAFKKSMTPHPMFLNPGDVTFSQDF